MNQPTNLVRLAHPQWGNAPALCLQRAPLYLRFVRRPLEPTKRSGPAFEWDALDLPEDQPDDCEVVIAAVRTRASSIHIDGTRNGRRFGEWLRTADYRVCAPQPSDDALRDTEQWREWCLAQTNQVQQGANP